MAVDGAAVGGDSDATQKLENAVVIPDGSGSSKANNKQSSETLAKIRDLYPQAAVFLKTLGLRRSTPGSYLAVEPLNDIFLRSCGVDPSTKEWKAMRKAAGRAMNTALLEQFGADLPRVFLPQGSSPETLCGSNGFEVESDKYPARPMRLAAGEAQAARAVRREKRQNDGDLAVRPAAEQGGSGVQEGSAAEAPKEGSSKYLSELLTLECGPELLRLRLFPDAKELTESFAAFHAVRKHLSSTFRPEDPDVTVVCVGDGTTPRTAALFAFRTKWQCYAVDPLMREPGDRWGGIDRLRATCAKIEDCETCGQLTATKLVIVCVHAHVGLAECLAALKWTEALGVVVIPCCNFYSRLQLSEPPLAEYHDTGVVSPHRLVRVYLQKNKGPAPVGQ